MIKQFRIAFGLKPGSSILTFRARHVPNAPEGCLEARWRDWHLTILLTNFSRICQKMPKYFFEIDVGGVRMDSYGSVWTRMGPYGPWGLPGGFLGPPGALGDPKRGVSGFWGWGWPGGPCCGSVSGCLGFLLAYYRNPYASASGCCGTRASAFCLLTSMTGSAGTR